MTKYYSLDYLDDNYSHSRYNMIFGERSNGKTFAVLERILKKWIYDGEKGAYIRRLDNDIKGDKAKRVWTALTDRNSTDLVTKYTNGEWTDVVFRSRAWYLAKFDDKLNKYVSQPEPFCYAFALNVAEGYKSTSYPGVTTILFDEFLSRNRYLRDEFVEYQNVLSTIIRQRNNVKVYMLGNTVNMYSPYFDEMGVDISDMQPGHVKEIELKGKDESLFIAAQYCKPNVDGKASDVYFQFGNRKLKMITDGAWEIPMYPHRPIEILPKDIVEIFFIDFIEKDAIVQGEIVAKDDNIFLYLHRKTTPIKDPDTKMVYRLNPSPKLNHAVSLTGPAFRNKISALIGRLIKEGQIYYQDNNIGELVRYYQEQAGYSLTDLA